MREYELVIDDALKNGLSPYPPRVNTQVLNQCYGFRCGKLSLESFVPLDNKIPSSIDMYYDWPFPQFMTGEKYNILVVRDSGINHTDEIYSISDDYLTVNHVFSLDVLNYGQGTMMELADFGEYIVMVNGVAIIFWNPSLSTWTILKTSTTFPNIRTICNLKGQAVGGNVVGTWYDCDETYYVWSKIGNIDFTLDQENDAGYRRCPYGGEVLNVRRLDNFVVGYSSKGITFIHTANEPAATMGFKEMHDIGIINQGAVNGNYSKHIFVGEDYNLYEVTPKGVNELGYKSYIESLAGEDIIVCYDSANKDFYIGNSGKTFLLSPTGMSEVNQHPSAVWRMGGETCMVPDAVDADEPYICTERFDMNYGGQKTISSIESDVSIVNDPEAGVDYTYDMNVWYSGYYKPMNYQGVSAINVSGNQFRFRLRFGTIYETTNLGYIKVRYKMTDLRGIRGVYAPPLRGQNA